VPPPVGLERGVGIELDHDGWLDRGVGDVV
jgi:hypothetical protein